ncbi:MAG TPA: hypothetical protein VF771_08895, partial [Longimicrobiaceae bacterium]
MIPSIARSGFPWIPPVRQAPRVETRGYNGPKSAFADSRAEIRTGGNDHCPRDHVRHIARMPPPQSAKADFLKFQRQVSTCRSFNLPIFHLPSSTRHFDSTCRLQL